MSDILKVAKGVKEAGLVGGAITLVAVLKDSKGTKEITVKEIPEQTLFVRTNPYNDFPSIYDEEGRAYVVTFIRDFTLEKATKEVAQFAKDQNMKMALTRLEKGFLIDNQGQLISNITKAGRKRRVKTEIISTNERVCMEVIKRRVEGGTRKGVQYTTKGIDQIKAMSEYGAKAKGWTLLSKVPRNAFNLIDAARFIFDLEKGTRSFSILPGIHPYTAFVSAIGALGDIYLRELEQDLNNIRIQQLEKAKEQGLIFVRDFVNKDRNWNGQAKAKINSFLDDGEFAFYLINTSGETADKVLAGEFRTFFELIPFITDIQYTEVVLLVKKIGHPKSRNNIFIVEDFYTLEK